MVATTRAPMSYAYPQHAPIPESDLPEGVYYDASGRLMRTTYQHTGFEDEAGTALPTPADVERVRRSGAKVYETHKEIPRECVIPRGRSLEEVEAERKDARLREVDFLHPTYGWLAFGRKRERESVENMGTGSIQRRIRKRAVNVDPPSTAMPLDGVAPEIDGPPGTDAQRRGPGRPPKPREEAV